MNATILQGSRQLEVELENLKNFVPVFQKAKEKKATDIYIMEGVPSRIGILKEYEVLPDVIPSRYEINDFVENTMSADIIDMSALIENSSGFSKFYEYGFSIRGFGRFRVNYSASEEGVGLALRKLPYTIPTLDSLDKYNFLDGVKRILNFRRYVPSGLILHTGITGSGKSTTIASEIDYIASRITGNILIFENPIEYQITMRKANVRHYEVNRHISSFLEGMNIALRNNPSVIMVGEVRTKDEIRSLFEIASKGHLVFSTLHTNNVMNTIRFLDEVGGGEGSWRQLFANSIKAIVSQKLVFKDDYILLAEVFIPDRVAKEKIAQGAYTELETMINGNQFKENGTITFKQAFDRLLRERVLTESEKDMIIEG